MKATIFLVVVLFVSGCTSDQPQTNDKTNILNCIAYEGNPIIKQGDMVSGATWNDPHVLKVDGQYVMYASADQNFDQKIKIYRLVSDDGIKWSISPSTHVFEGAHNDAWDAKNAETPAVVFFRGKYYLFYTGYQSDLTDVFSYKVGYAISDDGITWTRPANYLVVDTTDPRNTTPNFDFNQWVVGEPGPVVFNDKIYLYFTTVGADARFGTTLQTIGLVTSSDGINWSPAQKVLEPDQNIYPRNKGWIGYSTPHAAVIDGKMHLFYDVANENPVWKQVKIHHAVSADGISNWAQDKEAIFSREDFTWTKEEIRSPAVYQEGDTLKMWFAGHNSADYRDIRLAIGFATCVLNETLA